MKSIRRWQHWLLAVGALAVAVAAVELLGLVGETSTTHVARAAWERARAGGARSAERLAEEHAESREASERERPWSPAALEFPAPAANDRAPVGALRLDDHDPTRPGPRPNPLLEPKEHLTRDDTRAGLD